MFSENVDQKIREEKLLLTNILQRKKTKRVKNDIK